MPEIIEKPIRVAVVEDNLDNADLICSLIELDFGPHKVRHWVAGEVFLSEWNSDQPPTLVLLDLQLPQLDGYAVLNRLRQLPGGAGTKVIAVSANVLGTDLDAAQAAGFDGFLGKPLKIQRFSEQIRRILNGEFVWEPH
ncbi:MAG TPA: response regulator [Herpetosiphonaceae bacterium]|nr:response regulator [Herpetosiphonaceae bacterium]